MNDITVLVMEYWHKSPQELHVIDGQMDLSFAYASALKQSSVNLGLLCGSKMMRHRFTGVVGTTISQEDEFYLTAVDRGKQPVRAAGIQAIFQVTHQENYNQPQYVDQPLSKDGGSKLNTNLGVAIHSMESCLDVKEKTLLRPSDATWLVTHNGDARLSITGIKASDRASADRVRTQQSIRGRDGSML